MGLPYVSEGLGQHRANPPLRPFLSFLTWAEKQRSPHFSSDDQLAIENLLPVPFPLLNTLFLPPRPRLAFVLFSHVTKTRRAAVMDRTSSALAGF